MTREAGFKRRVRARMAMTGEAYSAARAHLDRSVLHVTNGDSVAGTLRAAGIGRQVLAWRDVLHDGPVPAAGPAELRRVRAAHLAARGWGEEPRIEEGLAARDELLGRHGPGEYVLWFEADLYDQLQIAQVLDALRRHRVEPERIMLVSVGEHRGIAHFGGLGELTGEQLRALLPAGELLTAAALDLAATAWAAFTAPDPAGLAAIARARSAQLRHLGEAFARLLQEYPSRTDGLSLTQRRILLAVAGGEATAAEVFRRVWDAERRPFQSDAFCYALVRELADGAAPLLVVDDGGPPFGGRLVRLAPAGHEVLESRRDHLRESGIDRWIGGVHLTGRATPWRYDERLEALITEPQ